MKHSNFLIILLALGLVFVSYKWITSSGSSSTVEAEVTGNVNPALEMIMTRTSVRAYTAQDVTKAQMDTLLRAAMAAPTAGNKQPWRFVVIRDRNTLDYIGDNFQSMSMMKQAPVGVVICGNPNATFEGDGRGYWIQDASAATENLLLAAHAIGLGAVWCGVYPMPDRVKQFSELLALPDSILPLNCIAIGHPASDPAPKDKWRPAYIHQNRW